MSTSTDPQIFENNAVEVAYNGDPESAWIDFDLHDDSRPEHESSIAARVMLSPEEAVEHVLRVLAEVKRVNPALVSDTVARAAAL